MLSCYASKRNSLQIQNVEAILTVNTVNTFFCRLLELWKTFPLPTQQPKKKQSDVKGSDSATRRASWLVSRGYMRRWTHTD